MKVRTLTAIIALLIFLTILLKGGLVLMLFANLLALIALKELLNMNTFRRSAFAKKNMKKKTKIKINDFLLLRNNIYKIRLVRINHYEIIPWWDYEFLFKIQITLLHLIRIER